MKVELDKKGMITLVMGSSPYYSVMDKEPIRSLGTYSDLSGWIWFKTKLEEITEEGLYNIYVVCRNSW